MPTAPLAAETPCWKTYATGLFLGAMAWGSYLGIRWARARWGAGQRLAAAGMGALVCLTVLLGLAVIAVGMSAG